MQIICDWGSSKLRAYLLDGEAAVNRYESDLGVKTISGERNQFPAELGRVIACFGCRPDIKIQVSGMAGSKNAWLDAGYVTTPASLADIASAGVAAPDFESAVILPGLKHVRDDGSVDLMRGEEVQAFGLLSIEPGVRKICLPGTHSKWVAIDSGKVTSFKSYLTGDLFSSLCEHSIFKEQIGSRAFDEKSFLDGCALANGGCSLDDLFRLRSDYVCAKVSERGFHSYLSGFLIANEIRAEGVSGTVYLCGSDALLHAYAIALQQVSVKVVSVGSEKATIAGHLAIRRSQRSPLCPEA